MSEPYKVAVLGAGNAGTTLAKVAADAGHTISLWTIEKEVHRAIIDDHVNHRYLDGVMLPSTLSCTMDLDECVSNADCILFAVPSHVVRSVARQAAGKIEPSALVVDIAKGIDGDTLQRMSQVIEEELGNGFEGNVVALSGPMIANELARGVPTTVAVSAGNMERAYSVQSILATDYFHCMTNPDTIGVELGGALKNIIALGAGLCDGLGYGLNTKSALVARGLSEITRLGTTMGAREMTFLGLSGLGDLYVTCTSEHSRNRTLGEKIGRGATLETGRREMVQVAEGVIATKVAFKLSEIHGVELPITRSIHRILYDGDEPSSLLSAFVRRSEEMSGKG